MSPIILASSSVYRKELLSRLKVPFTCYSSNIDETAWAGESIEALTQRLAREKSEACANENPDAICIGSDELAELNGELLGKPGNKESAIKQLKAMSGQQVKFYTAVNVTFLPQKHSDTRLSVTTITFKSLTDEMIENYLEKEQPYNSAASFKSETLGSALLTKFESDDPTGIIGLPLIMLCDMLEAAGARIL